MEPLIKYLHLQVGDSYCCNHSKHNEEHASDDRVRNGDEHGSKFSKHPQNDHQNPSCLEDESAANLSAVKKEMLTSQNKMKTLKVTKHHPSNNLGISRDQWTNTKLTFLPAFCGRQTSSIKINEFSIEEQN